MGTTPSVKPVNQHNFTKNKTDKDAYENNLIQIQIITTTTTKKNNAGESDIRLLVTFAAQKSFGQKNVKRRRFIHSDLQSSAERDTRDNISWNILVV